MGIWNKKVEVIPIIIGTTGIVYKNIKKYVGRIPGHQTSTNCRYQQF